MLGDEHPETLTARDALAVAYRLTGDVDDAVALSALVTAQRTKALGAAHPDTLTSRMGLALARAAAGAIESAYAVLTSAIADAEKALGANHRQTVALLECGRQSGLIR